MEKSNKNISIFLDKRQFGIFHKSNKKAKLKPIEVKSFGYNTHKPLYVFCEKYAHVVERRYLIYTKDLKTDKGSNLLPVYMPPFLGE